MATSTSLPAAAPASHEDATMVSLLADVQAALGAYQQDPATAAPRERLRNTVRELAKRVLDLPKREPDVATVQNVLRAVHQLANSGAQDYPLSGDDRALLADRGQQQWTTLLAQMLLGAAWQWGEVPDLSATPQWLWGDYTTWLFATPKGFTGIGDADRYAACTLRHVEELARLIERNAGSVAVRAAGDAYLRAASAIPLYFAADSLRRHAEARGRILKRLIGREQTPYDPMPFPRTGRRLRVGFLNRHFGSQTETYTTLPTFEQLDPERFEVILFSLHAADTPLAQYCRSKAQDYRVLPPDFEGQLVALRDANLDVLVFGTNLTAVVHELTRLALYRIAPLQVVNNSSCITTGLPEIDLYVSGDVTETEGAAAHFSERLGLIPGPAHAFNYLADAHEPSTTWTRASLGIPDDAIVFATAANYYKIIPEMQRVWAKLLASIPNSRLVVHPFNPNWSSSYPIKRFCADFDRALAEEGVGSDRLVVSTMKFPSRSDVAELLKVADVYLDTFPFGGVNSLVDPLESGIPSIVWEGETFRSRMGAALLRTLNLPELIAANEAEYLEKAKALATDPTRRSALSHRIRAAMARMPVFLDTLAASDAFGDVIEVAFDQIVDGGLKEFRKQRTPLRVAALPPEDTFDQISSTRLELRKAPADPKARHAYGAALLSVGNAKRATEYLLAAVQRDEKNSALWFDLAQAFRANGQMKEALESLQASLRLNVKNAAGWTMVADVAQSVGAEDLAAEATQVLQHLASGALDGVEVPQL